MMTEHDTPNHPAAPLCIVLWSVKPDDPQRAMTPFVFAAVAAALDEPVEVFFTAGTVRLLVEGVAAGGDTAETNLKTLYDHMREAHEAGARFYACSMAMHAYVTPDDRLIPEFDGIRGVTTVLAESFEYDKRLLIF